MSLRGLLVFYGIPAFVFTIMYSIEKSQQEVWADKGTLPPSLPPFLPPFLPFLLPILVV
jgi:hypothetical protein